MAIGYASRPDARIGGVPASTLAENRMTEGVSLKRADH
jgi:hypothetical protein